MTSTVVMASSTRSPRAMMSAPSEMRCRSMRRSSMIGNTIAIVSGIDSATTAPGRKPRLTMLTAMMMAIACQREVVNSLIAVLTTTGWSETRLASMPSGRWGGRSVVGLCRVAPKRKNAATVAHGDGEADRRPAVDAKHRLRRIGIAASDGRNVAQPDQPAVGQEIDVEKVRFRPESAGNAKQNLLVAGLERARRTDGVLGSERRDQRRPVDAESRQLLGRKLNVDLLVLGAEKLDLRHVRNLQETRADVLDVVAEFAVGG